MTSVSASIAAAAPSAAHDSADEGSTVPVTTPSVISPTEEISGTDAVPSPSDGETPAPTPHDDNAQAFDATPDGTGNSGGQIAFMLIIFLVCLFFIIEGIVHWLRKKKQTYVNPEDDWRRR